TPSAVHRAVCESPALSVMVPLNDAEVPVAKTQPLAGGDRPTVGAGLLTVTVKLPDTELSAASRAVQVTVVVPIGNTEPEATEVEYVTPGQLSNTVGAKLTRALQTPGSVVRTMFGHTATGGVLSTTVTSWVLVTVFPLGSAAV